MNRKLGMLLPLFLIGGTAFAIWVSSIDTDITGFAVGSDAPNATQFTWTNMSVNPGESVINYFEWTTQAENAELEFDCTDSSISTDSLCDYDDLDTKVYVDVDDAGIADCDTTPSFSNIGAGTHNITVRVDSHNLACPADLTLKVMGNLV